MTDNPELLAANSILKRGVRYRIPAPLFVRFFGITTVPITITQMYRGTDVRISAILAEKGITEKYLETADAHELMSSHYNTVRKIVALAVTNSRHRAPLRYRINRWLLGTISVWRLYELYTTVLQYSGAKSFTLITRLALATRATRPNLGQMETRS